MVAAGHAGRVQSALEAEGIVVVAWEHSRVEPTLESLRAAAKFAQEARVDGFVSVGGGSSIDTAKVADLVVSHPADVMDYVNAPVGAGRQPPGPLLAHLAIPTTGGSGSEATTVVVLDLPELKLTSGISHRYLRPAHAYAADPERHHRAAELLTGTTISAPGPESLPDALLGLMRDVGAPSGLGALGYDEGDVGGLVEGALRQQRLLVLAPREPDAGDLARILRESMANW